MQTFDSALFKLYKEGRITLEEALKNADSRNNLRLKITLSEKEEGGGSDTKAASKSFEGKDGKKVDPKLAAVRQAALKKAAAARAAKAGTTSAPETASATPQEKKDGPQVCPWPPSKKTTTSSEVM